MIKILDINLYIQMNLKGMCILLTYLFTIFFLCCNKITHFYLFQLNYEYIINAKYMYVNKYKETGLRKMGMNDLLWKW